MLTVLWAGAKRAAWVVERDTRSSRVYPDVLGNFARVQSAHISLVCRVPPGDDFTMDGVVLAPLAVKYLASHGAFEELALDRS